MPDERVTLRDAAIRLEVSEGAIRKRVARGTIRSERGDDGLRYVWVGAGTDEGADTSSLNDSHAFRSEAAELVSELRAQVGYLREQLKREQDAHVEARRIIAALTSRIPAIEAPDQEPLGAPKSVVAQPDGEDEPWFRCGRLSGGG